jgi:adenine-specific DNA-methyltransferase
VALAKPDLRGLLKETGSYYTPPEMARFLVRWAVRRPEDVVLDPSSGGGEFLEQSVLRLRQLGSSGPEAAAQVHGVEIDPDAAALARTRLGASLGLTPTLTISDFFSTRPARREFSGRLDATRLPEVDVVVGNPPYIRYHLFRGDVRASAASAVAPFGIRLTDLTSSWAPFVIHSTTFLRKTGRLAFVLPAELLYVDYARPIREFLLKQYSAVTLIAFDTRVFPGVLADTILLLAERGGAKRGLSIIRLRTLADLPTGDEPLARTRGVSPLGPGRRWSYLLLPPTPRATYARLEDKPTVVRLGSQATVDIGIVSGRNDYFLLSESQRLAAGLSIPEVIPIVCSSRQLLGSHLGEAELAAIRKSGQKCWLLDLAGKSKPSPEARAYLDSPPATAAKSGYKSSSRRQWYEVPSVYSPTAFMSYFISEAPRFIVNLVGATSTNTIHRLRLKDSAAATASPLVLSCYSSLTMLSSEVEGRSYGGGVAKLETKEAENLLVVLPSADSSRALQRIEPTVHAALADSDLPAATRLVDEILLEAQLGLSAADRRALDEGVEALRSRRRARMKRPSRTNS